MFGNINIRLRTGHILPDGKLLEKGIKKCLTEYYCRSK